MVRVLWVRTFFLLFPVCRLRLILLCSLLVRAVAFLQFYDRSFRISLAGQC